MYAFTLYSSLKLYLQDIHALSIISPEQEQKKHYIHISLAVRPPNLTNVTKITYLQAWIENSMPTELKKMQ